MPKIEDKTFRISIRVKNCKEVFKEGLKPGILGFTEVTYKNIKIEDDGGIPSLLVADLLDKAKDVRNDIIEELIEEVFEEVE